MQLVNPVATTCCLINFSLFANTIDYQTVIVLLNQLYGPIVTVSTSLIQLLFVLIAEVAIVGHFYALRGHILESIEFFYA